MRQVITEGGILVCIVLYKQSLYECNTFKTLQKTHLLSALDVLVYDNSPEPLENINSINCEKINLHYKHNSKNDGVAGGYNYAAEIATSLQKTFLFLLDQDTTLSEDFIFKMLGSINVQKEINIFCPITISNQKIISPSKYYFTKAFLQKKIAPGITTTKKQSLINSGLAVELNEFFKLKGFDKELPLDFSDHYFFFKYKKSNNYFFVVETINIHELSAFFETDYEKNLNRFKLYFSSALIFSRKTKSVMPIIWAVLRGLKLSVLYKKRSFIAYTLHLLGK